MTIDRESYQGRLRALGAYIDGEGASSILVIETLDGFLVRWQEPQSEQTIHEVAVNEADLRSLADLDLTLRRFGDGGDVAASGHYQDLLRSIGHELDQLDARFILLDQVEDSIFVSYQCPNPTEHFTSHKQMKVFGTDDQGRLLQQARARRRPTRYPARGVGSSVPPRSAPQQRGDDGREAPVWTPGERERYRMDLPRAWFGPNERYDGCALILTNRQLVLRTVDGPALRVFLDTVTQILTRADRRLLSKVFHVDVHRDGHDPISLECMGSEQMTAVADQLEQALAQLPEPR